MIRVAVDSHLRLDTGDLDDIQIAKIKLALTILNPEKEAAEREQIRGWEKLPDTIELWHQKRENFTLPRGFAAALESTISEEVEWDDQRVTVPINTDEWGAVRFTPERQYQQEAIEDMIACEQGVYEAPPAAGKTVTFLELARRLEQRTIVIVNNTHIARQWQHRAQDWLGVEAGIIGDGKWKEDDLTIAIQQTLWARRDEIEGDWWSQWGTVGLDECHHVPARTFYDIIQRFPAYYRFGVSATPDKNEEYWKLVGYALGPTVAETPREELIRLGVIKQPVVKILDSSFEFTLWPTHRPKKDPETGKLTCKFKDRGCDRGGLVHRNNWTDLIAALIADEERNELIAGAILEEYIQGRAILVLSRRLEHLDNLATLVANEVGLENLFRLSGKEKTDERLELYERADAGGLVIFSTIGDEAMDIPRLDTLVPAFPTKNPGLVEQQLGRIARAHAHKGTPRVIDIRDRVVSLQKQLSVRQSVYREQGLKFVD